MEIHCPFSLVSFSPCIHSSLLFSRNVCESSHTLVRVILLFNPLRLGSNGRCRALPIDSATMLSTSHGSDAQSTCGYRKLSSFCFHVASQPMALPSTSKYVSYIAFEGFFTETQQWDLWISFFRENVCAQKFKCEDMAIYSASCN